MLIGMLNALSFLLFGFSVVGFFGMCASAFLLLTGDESWYTRGDSWRDDDHGSRKKLSRTARALLICLPVCLLSTMVTGLTSGYVGQMTGR